jgi:hypothetical protein
LDFNEKVPLFLNNFLEHIKTFWFGYKSLHNDSLMIWQKSVHCRITMK